MAAEVSSKNVGPTEAQREENLNLFIFCDVRVRAVFGLRIQINMLYPSELFFEALSFQLFSSAIFLYLRTVFLGELSCLKS